MTTPTTQGEKPWNILIACEESQAVCIEMRRRGHNAFSNDIQECSGGHPEWHLQMDCMVAINSRKWDLIIAHIPCTYFAAPGMHYLKTRPERMILLKETYNMLLQVWHSDSEKIVIENPVGWLNTNWKKPSQIIQPYFFGDQERKQTCLWIKGLPLLIPMDNFTIPKPDGYTKPNKKDGYLRGIYLCGRINSKVGRSNQKLAAKMKSKTFPGIARAMAEQWTPLIK